ncbi:hypothetical protein Dimus_003813, partial [Dionaea muscipula]
MDQGRVARLFRGNGGRRQRAGDDGDQWAMSAVTKAARGWKPRRPRRQAVVSTK